MGKTKIEQDDENRKDAQPERKLRQKVRDSVIAMVLKFKKIQTEIILRVAGPGTIIKNKRKRKDQDDHDYCRPFQVIIAGTAGAPTFSFMIIIIFQDIHEC